MGEAPANPLRPRPPVSQVTPRTSSVPSSLAPPAESHFTAGRYRAPISPGSAGSRVVDQPGCVPALWRALEPAFGGCHSTPDEAHSGTRPGDRSLSTERRSRWQGRGEAFALAGVAVRTSTSGVADAYAGAGTYATCHYRSGSIATSTSRR